jgi:hypothetical protein
LLVGRFPIPASNNNRGKEKAMTEKQARVKGAELDAKEQAVMVELAELREQQAALETKRERIRMERATVYIAYTRAQK